MPIACHRLLIFILLAGAVCTGMPIQPARAQAVLRIRGRVVPFDVFGGIHSGQTELTPAQIDTVPGTTETRLEQVRALSAAGEWDEAVDTLLDLMADADADDGLMEITPDRFVSLGQFCQMQITQLPPPALERYRRRVDPVAESWYRDGLARRDRRLLARVVDEMFASSWGDDALWALGELALERADYQAARTHWGRISPLLCSPGGQAEWFALVGIDLAAHWNEVNDAWNNRAAPPDWLAYPDTDLDLATVRARLALISIRAGNLDRAAFEVDLIRRRHADATGRLAGKSQPLVATLETMLDGAATWPELRPDDDWPMVGGGPARDGRSASLSRVTAPAWAAPIRYVPASTKVQRTFADDAGGDPRPSDPPLRYVPIVAGNQVLYRGSRHVKAADLTTGRPAVTDDGTLYRADLASRSSNITLFGSGQVGGGVLLGSPRYTLTAADGIAYAVVGSTITARPFAQGVANSMPSQQQLVGLDLGRDGLLTFKAKPNDGEWAFEGAPVVDDQSLYITMRHSDVKPRAFVACYDLADGKLRWRTPICAADLPVAGQGDAISNSLLTLAGDTIYFNTNLGAVAAVDKHDGQLRWVRRYERATTGVAARSAAHFRRELAPCIVADGIVMAAPTDTPLVIALDAATGKTLWVTKHAGDAIDLVGVADGNLIATGDRCRGIDIRTGKLQFVWPESQQPGFVGRGRGCLAGKEEVYWPTRREIYVLDAATGAQTRRPIDISSYTDCGANLVATHGLLLVATADQLIALGPTAAAPPQKPQPAPAESTLSSIVIPRPPTPDP